MLSFDPMATALAATYFLGIFLHYTHIRTIFVMSDLADQMDHTKALFNSSIWVLLTLHYLLMFLMPSIFMPDDDEDEDY